MRNFFVCCLSVFLLISCSHSTELSTASGDISDDTESDKKLDEDTSTKSNSGTGANTNIDTFTNTDSDTDVDANSDEDSDTESDTILDSSSDTKLDTASDTAPDTNSDMNAATGADTESATGADTESATGADTESEAGSEAGSDTESNTVIDSDTGPELSTDCSAEPNFTLCVPAPGIEIEYNICVDGECQSPGCGTSVCNAPSPNFSTATTRQYILIPETPYANTQPVVFDNVTKLYWQGCAEGKTGGSCAGNAVLMNWATALQRCEDLDWGGYTDWRLPNEFELQSIVEYRPVGSSINTSFFPNTPAAEFWTSSVCDYCGWENGAFLDTAWDVYFNGGHMEYTAKSLEYYVRCVRSEPRPAPSRFEITEPAQGEPIVTDNITGLLWQGCSRGLRGIDCSIIDPDTGTDTDTSAETSLLTVVDAQNYCEDLQWGALSHWRLPTIMELRGIVDSRKKDPAIDGDTFPNTPVWWFWSSSVVGDSGAMLLGWYFGVVYGVDDFVFDATLVPSGITARCVHDR